MLSYPLQAEQAKPFFVLDKEQQLVTKNIPVPRIIKPAVLRSNTLTTIIFGDSLRQYRSNSPLRNSQIWRRLLPSKASTDKTTVFKILDELTCPLRTIPVIKLGNNLNWTHKEVTHVKKTLA